MAYNELIKSFQRIRSYMREFYVYGFRTRDEFSGKSGRSYDNERRRLESVLGNYTLSARAAGGKNVYLSIDSRSGENPLYRLLKSCSFTDRDVTLHFILFDILDSDIPLTLAEIMIQLERYTAVFSESISFDESGVRKKLSEYERLGLVRIEKQGRAVSYYRSRDCDLADYAPALEFFSETAVCGAVGSFVLDKLDSREHCFGFKHHYITGALDTEVMYGLLSAISDKRIVTLDFLSPRNGMKSVFRVLPLKIFVSVQNGRQWLMAHNFQLGDLRAYRLDYIEEVTAGEICSRFDELRSALDEVQKTMWGVSVDKNKPRETVEFTIFIGDGEEYIYNRLMREKRCGTVTRLDEHTARFSAEVQDSGELVPWIRTFIGRIIQLDFTDRTLENRLRSDIEAMYEIYGIGGDDNAVP